MVDIRVKLFGAELRNPTILASGVMGVSAASCAFIEKNGAGAIIPKSVGPKEKEGHNNPVLVELDNAKGFLNAVGLPSAGVDSSLPEVELAIKSCPVPVFPSLYGGTKEDYVLVAEKLASLKPKALELNLSCPNTASDFGEAFALNPDSASAVVRAVRSKVKVPLIAKLAPNVPSIRKVAKAVEEAGADAISAINTMPGMSIDVKSGKPILQNKQGGISGPALKPIAVNCIYDIYETVEIPIIGIGGVMTGEDAAEMIMAGASAVQIGTGIYYRGADVFSKVSKELESLMSECGYSSINKMKGIAHR